MSSDLICPQCKKSLRPEESRYFCAGCNIFYPVDNGINCFVNRESESDGFNEETYTFLFDMEKKHFWHVGRKEIIYQMLKIYIKDRISSIRLLEIGCGNGSVAEHLKKKGINVEGGDVSMKGLSFCRERVDIPLYQIDALNTPFHTESYDIIGMFDVMEHITDDQLLLNEVFRICKKNGKVIITVPAYKSLWSYFDVMSGHERRYTKHELIYKLENSGFKVNRVTFFMFFLFPVYWVFRRLNIFPNYYKKKEFKDLSEVKTLPIINNIFLAILRVENKLLAKLNLPFGVSLICIAEKS
ncbi:class I SAM-dependent methyltransferase [bacterium]|nr:class I SAM-dependent methyltransferase [bacterium]